MQTLRSIQAKIRQSIPFALNDFKRRYAGSLLGFLWAYIQNLVMILIYWLVFEFGLRSGSVNDAPFVVWFTCGLMPWMCFSELVTGSTSVMFEYSYIVKKVVFDIDVLPLMRMIVSLMVHIFFLFLIIVVAMLKGVMPTLYTLQTLYYLLCIIMLAAPLAYFGSAVSVLVRDYSQVIGIALNVMMWATPIVWNPAVLPAHLQWIIFANPVYYVVQGMRDSVIYQLPFWSHGWQTLYFWGVTALLWFVCIKVYRRLVPHLADVL